MGKREQTYYAGIPRTGIVFCLITAGVIMSVLVVSSCSRKGRHKALTFFFEGVPPLYGDEQGLRLRITRTTNIDLLSSATLRRKMGGSLSQKAGSIHAAARDCRVCHIGPINKRQHEVIKPVPELCYSCHLDHQNAGGYLHGPISSAGICLFCHDPHQSAYIYLQRAPQPDLCYRCHLREDMGTIVGHEERVDAICTNCHEPHTSSMDKLLKPYEEIKGDPNTLSFMYELLKPDQELQGDPNTVKGDPNTVNLSK